MKLLQKRLVLANFKNISGISRVLF